MLKMRLDSDLRSRRHRILQSRSATIVTWSTTSLVNTFLQLAAQGLPANFPQNSKLIAFSGMVPCLIRFSYDTALKWREVVGVERRCATI